MIVLVVVEFVGVWWLMRFHRLSVCVVEAKDIPPNDGSGLFVAAFVGNRQGLASPAASAGVWNHIFYWRLDQAEGLVVRLQLWAQGNQATLLGEVEHGLSDMPREGDLERWLNLKPSGSLHVKISLTPSMAQGDSTVQADTQSFGISQSYGDTVDDDCPFGADEVRRAADDIGGKGVLPPPDMREWVIRMLQRRRVYAVMRRDYAVADAAADTIAVYERMVAGEGIVDIEELTTARLWERYSSLQARIDAVNAAHDKSVSRLRVDEEERVADLRARQERERAELEKYWAQPPRLLAFSKPSPELLAVRHQERQMALGGEYGQALQMKARADALEVHETDKAQRRLEARMAWELGRLAEAHEMQLRALRRAADDSVKRQEASRQAELRPLCAALGTIHVRKLGMGRQWYREPPPDCRCVSPRSRASLADFRRNPPAEPLPVQLPSARVAPESSGAGSPRKSAASAASTPARRRRRPRPQTLTFTPVSSRSTVSAGPKS